MANTTANAKTPLLPHNVRQAHRLSSPQITFPARGAKAHHVSAVTTAGSRLPSSYTQDAEVDWQRGQTGLVPVKDNGLPKLSRQCLVSEIKCYGKYIVAVLVVFGMGGVMLALWIAKAH